MRALATALALLVAAPAAAEAKSVTAMVVGKTRVLKDARNVHLAKKRRVKVGGHRCTVAGNTALGALAALRMKVRVRDYGSCGRRPADAAGLFVRRIGPDANRGQDGWVYKIGRRSPGTGAADTSGRRLRGGDRVLWFWCHAHADGGCQRTLEATPDRASAAPGEQLRVTVRGYDNDAHGALIEGATVTLGGASAVTGADGVATLTVAASGPLRLVAAKDGLVRSFPRVVRAG
jgi:hypothetical protein